MTICMASAHCKKVGPWRYGQRHERMLQAPFAVKIAASAAANASNPTAIHTICDARACRCQLSHTR